jgi:hypothetical protein
MNSLLDPRLFAREMLRLATELADLTPEQRMFYELESTMRRLGFRVVDAEEPGMSRLEPIINEEGNHGTQT